MEKIIFRNLERNTLKLEKNLMFNETCYNNDILPTYTYMIILFLSELIIFSYFAGFKRP